MLRKETNLAKIVAQYRLDIRISIIQIFTSIVPFFFCWYFAYRSLEVSYLLTLFFCALSALFVFRSFILLHDCGRSSFSKNQKFNDIIGIITGVIIHALLRVASQSAITVPPQATLTAGWACVDADLRKFRSCRVDNACFTACTATIRHLRHWSTIDFLILQRIGSIVNVGKAHEKWSVVYTTCFFLLAIIRRRADRLAISSFNCRLLRWRLQLACGCSCGTSSRTCLERHENWNADAALHGSSFYNCRALQWCTGNIGFHPFTTSAEDSTTGWKNATTKTRCLPTSAADDSRPEVAAYSPL